MATAAQARLSIGALSRATGIPVETLRTWESRYGFPVPDRRPSGHRVYAASLVPRLRRIGEAIARGHRAGQVVAASDAALTTLLAEVESATTAPARPRPADESGVDDLLDAVKRYDEARLTRLLLADWGRLGVLAFLEDRVGPLLDAVGLGWAGQTLEIRHEHFLSEQVGGLLRALRAPLDQRASGPVCVIATLPGEHHGLGLLMAALAVASADLRVRLAGTDLPVAQLASFAREVHARVVAISISSAGAATAGRHLRALARRLPRHTLLIAGGAGAPDGLARVEHLPDFAALDARLRKVARP